MVLLSKISNGFQKIKEGFKQGIQGAKSVAGKSWNTTKNFVVDNSETIGNVLDAVAAPLMASKEYAALGGAAKLGAKYLHNLKPGPVKEKLKDVVEKISTNQAVLENRRNQAALENRINQLALENKINQAALWNRRNRRNGKNERNGKNRRNRTKAKTFHKS